MRQSTGGLATGMMIRPLRELVQEILVGIPVPRGEIADEGTTCPVINVRDLADGRVASPLDAMNFSARSAVDRYRVCRGDVLLTSRGTQLKVALVGEEAVGAVATSNLLVIRPDVEFPGALLYGYLCSPSIQGMLMRSSRSSSGLLSLTAREVGELCIPVPPIERLAQLARLVEETEQYYHAAVAAALAAREAVQGVVMAELGGLVQGER